jgi:hypothetical protein
MIEAKDLAKPICSVEMLSERSVEALQFTKE